MSITPPSRAKLLPQHPLILTHLQQHRIHLPSLGHIQLQVNQAVPHPPKPALKLGLRHVAGGGKVREKGGEHWRAVGVVHDAGDAFLDELVACEGLAAGGEGGFGFLEGVLCEVVSEDGAVG